MKRKPTYKELEQKIISLETELRTFNNKSSDVHCPANMVKDITEKKQKETALQESAERYRLLAENTTDMIWTADMNMMVTYVTPSVFKLRGYKPEEVLTQTLEDMFTPPSIEIVVKTFEKAFKNYNLEQSYKLELEQKCKDGSTIWTELIASFVLDESGQPVGIHGVSRDISDRIRTETALKKAMKEAETANSKLLTGNKQLEQAVNIANKMAAQAEMANIAKRSFFANLSHEIRTPLTGIIGFADMILDTKMDEEQIEYAKTIQSSSIALLSLINDTLDFSKIESGKIEFETIEFDPELIAYDVCDLIRPRLGTKPVEILCRIGDHLPSIVNGDPLRFRQVLTNLMGNASKFTKSGEIELSLDVEDENENQLKIHATIRDTGEGIPKDKLEDIFVPFQQMDLSTTRHYGGTGLGLTICKQISNLMDGNVWAESEINRGSLFHFTAWLGKSKITSRKKIYPVSLLGTRILIVDDNQTNLNILTHILQSEGLDAIAIEDGANVVPTLKKAIEKKMPIALCICDIQMMAMTGYEIATQVRDPINSLPRIPLIALSSKKDAKQCKESGFDGYLSKPIRRNKLFKMLKILLGEASDEKVPGQNADEEMITQYSIQEVIKHSVHILLVEDNPVNQKLAETLLVKAGYYVEIAVNGMEAVEKYTTSPENFDLILMDIQMPILDGLQATKTIRAKGFTTIPIVALTAQAMEKDREDCLYSGMNDYITKPINRETIFRVIEKWLIDEKE